MGYPFAYSTQDVRRYEQHTHRSGDPLCSTCNRVLQGPYSSIVLILYVKFMRRFDDLDNNMHKNLYISNYALCSVQDYAMCGSQSWNYGFDSET